MNPLFILLVTVSTSFLLCPAAVAQSSQNNQSDRKNINQMIKEAREKKEKQDPSGNPLDNARSSNIGKGVVIGEDDFFQAEGENVVEQEPEPTTDTDSSVNTKPPKVDNIFDF